MQFIKGCRESLQYGKDLEVLNFFSGCFAFFISNMEFSYFSFFLILLSSATCFTLLYYLNKLPHLPFPVRIVVPHFLPELSLWLPRSQKRIFVWSAHPKILIFFLSYSFKIEEIFNHKQWFSSATKATVFASPSSEQLGLANCYNFGYIDDKKRFGSNSKSSSTSNCRFWKKVD